MRQIFIACALFLSSVSPLAAYDFSKVTEKPKAVAIEVWNKTKRVTAQKAQEAKKIATNAASKAKEVSGTVVEKIKGIFSRLQKKEKISQEEKKQVVTPGVTVGDVVKAAEDSLNPRGDKKPMAPRLNKGKKSSSGNKARYNAVKRALKK